MKPLDPDNLQLELVDGPPLDVGPLIRAALTTDLLAAVDDTEETVAARSRVHVLDNGICTTCHPTSQHELVDGACETCSDAEPMGEHELALLAALDELDGENALRAAWDPGKHPRGPGGKFRSIVDRLKEAIEKHHRGEGDGHPFDGFDREQLRRVAKQRGIHLDRGEDRDSIASKLLEHLGEPAHPAAHPVPEHTPARPRRPAPNPPAARRPRAASAAVQAGRAATVSSLVTEQLWRERTDSGRRRLARDIADATWWQDNWTGADDLRSVLRRYGNGESSIQDLQRAGVDLETRHHLEPRGLPGAEVRYDPDTMEPSTNFGEDGIRQLMPGDRAEVTAPGYVYTGGRTPAQVVRTRVRAPGGRTDTPPAHRPHVERPVERPHREPARPGLPQLMLDGETEVPTAGTMFDRAAAAVHGASPWEEHNLDPKPFRQILGDSIAGLDIHDVDVLYGTSGDSSVMRMNGRLKSGGRDVGVFTVTFRRDGTGKISAYHDYLSIEPEHQGSGFANEYGLKLLTWYRESGVHEMTLHANIDVGGYAWARMGFNWSQFHEADDMADSLHRGLDDPGSQLAYRLSGSPNEREQRALGRELFERMRAARTLDQYPTPYEISQLGRWPGAGKDDMWIGKALLLGSSWHGTLTLGEVESR